MEPVLRELYTHLNMYPGMELIDCIKLLYQNAMGIGHLLEDTVAFTEYLHQEREEMPAIPSVPQNQDSIGNELVRIHLAGLEQGLSSQTFAKLCVLSAQRTQPNEEMLRHNLHILQREIEGRRLPFDAGSAVPVIQNYLEKGAEQPHHSERYRQLYSPHYRLLNRVYALYLPVFTAIDKALGQKPAAVVAIDGMSGAGKSHLNTLLQQVYGCGAVQADDFFLRPEQRSPARLLQPGGNIDYERMAPVVEKITGTEEFTYQAFDCREQAMGEWRTVPACKVTLVEGVYSMHPKVAAKADVKIFLGVDAAIQRHRIVQRNGAEFSQRFFDEWIPMENSYFSEFRIREGSDVVIDTSSLENLCKKCHRERPVAFLYR